MAVNKGNSNFNTHSEFMKQMMDENKPDVAIFSEANFDGTEDNKDTFPEHEVIGSFMDNCKKARLAIAIKRDINYIIDQGFNKNDTSVICIKL